MSWPFRAGQRDELPQRSRDLAAGGFLDGGHEHPHRHHERARRATASSSDHELASYRDYVSNEPLAYWRSTSGFEVDFLLGDHTGVEAKAQETGLRGSARSQLRGPLATARTV